MHKNNSAPILLIDDNPVTNYLHKALIKDLDLSCEVVVGENGKVGLDLLETALQKQTPPRLILLDLNMPVMDGFVFLENYNNRKYDQLHPTILAVLTSSSHPRDMDKLKELGVAFCYSKPLTKENLLVLLNAYTDYNKLNDNEL